MSSKTRYRRIKVGRLPGDFAISLCAKLIDGPKRFFKVFKWQTLSGDKIRAGFKEKRKMKERAVLKERLRDELDE